MVDLRSPRDEYRREPPRYHGCMTSLRRVRVPGMMLFAAGALTACKKESEKTATTPASAPTAPIPPSDASVAVASDATALSAATCEPQHFAVAGACPSGGRC